MMRWIQESNRGRGFRSGGAHSWIITKLHLQYNWIIEKREKLSVRKNEKRRVALQKRGNGCSILWVLQN